jgi:hypothetical protein
MSKAHHLVALAGLLSSAAVLAVGCVDYVAEYYTPLTNPNLASDGGNDSGPSPECIPSQNSTAVADDCGVFVSSDHGSDTTGKGTKEAPFATLGAALKKGSTIYACAGAVSYSEALKVDKKVVLFGGLDCASWVYGAAKTGLTADADHVPLTLTSAASGSEIHDFAITAEDAVAAGGSSIGIIADHADVGLDKVDVAAGVGQDGAPGTAQNQVQTPPEANGKDGADDAACNVGTVIPGGAGGTNACNGTQTDGGKGGKGAPVSTGDSGGDGLPLMTPGNGGSGQTASASCNANSVKGADGGTLGTPNPGVGARGIGDISEAGYVPPAATLGEAGHPGHGGGGGGAARACDAPQDNYSGPSGGGGGAGGCGGAPGNPGQSGGSSIGIALFGAKLTLNAVTITVRSGGKGGLGGDGQLGGSGGNPGHALGNAACDGGKGGQGSAGGPGGGGAGGHSVGIAAKDAKLPALGSTTIHHEAGALGGAGGDMDTTDTTKGDPGLGCKTLDFADAKSCAP